MNGKQLLANSGSPVTTPQLVAVVIALTILTGVGLTWRSIRIISYKDVSIGGAVPDVLLHRSPGSAVSLYSQLSPGSLTVIPLFSPDCQSCVGEARVWQELAQRHKDDVVFLGAASTTDPALVEMVRKEGGLTFPVMRIESNSVKALGFPGLPAVLVIDGQGDRQFESVGPESTAALAEWLTERLGRGESMISRSESVCCGGSLRLRMINSSAATRIVEMQVPTNIGGSDDCPWIWQRGSQQHTPDKEVRLCTDSDLRQCDD